MKQTAIQTLALAAIVAAVVGCKSSPQFAWWKNEKAPEDTSVVARSAKPTLPSAQSKPEAVAVAGLTPATSPSSSNLAAAGTPAGAAPLAAAPAGAMPPNVSIPVSPGTVANAPAATYPADGLADKLVTTPRPGAAGLGATSPAAGAAAVPTTGPYDPNGYKPAAALAANDSDPSSSGPDRYGISSATPAAPAAASAMPTNALPANPGSLTSDPADRYSSRTAPTAAATPDTTPLMDPAAVAADRYSNQKLPTLQNKAIETPPVAAASPAAVVRLASAPGQYRPGNTSSYSAGATITASPIEVASRPSPPSSTNTAPPATTAAPGTTSQPWTPPAPAAPTGRTY